MTRQITLTALLCACVLNSVIAARQSAQQPAPQPASGNASASRPVDDPILMTNVRVDVTVTDSMGAAAPVKKTVSLITVDGRMGRIRSVRDGTPAVLNVDASPTLINNQSQVRLQLTLEYSPPLTGEPAARLANVSQTVTLMLIPGKPLVVSQTTDPASERKVTVEVTATILK